MTGPSKPSPTNKRRLEIDPRQCQSCGRDALGLRCDVPITLEYERELVRARAARPAGHEAPQLTAPCSDACPLSLCIQGYVKNIAAGNYGDALRHVMAGTALPETVCRVCHRPCEDVCVTRETGAPIRVNDLKRFVVTRAGEGGHEAGQVTEPNTKAKAVDPEATAARPRVAVVGAGPSGLTAASELRRRGYDVTMYDAAERPGGLLTSVLPAYRLPAGAVERDIEGVLSSGVVFRGGQALGRDFTLRSLLADGNEAVYLAIGAHRSRSLGLAPPTSEQVPEVVAALPFLASARTEPRRSLSGPVLVIGGGDAAIDSARTALRLGAERVTIACIESRVDMPALRDQVALAEAEGIVIRNELTPIRFEEMAVAFEGKGIEGSQTIEAHFVVTAIGQEPDLTCLDDDDLALVHTSKGHLTVDEETGQTSHPRIFAGGDIASAHRTVTEAMGSAMRAAWAIDREVRGLETANERRPPPRPSRRSAREPSTTTRPQRALRDEGFSDSTATLTAAEARAEAERCLACGLCGNCHACLDVFGCPAMQPGDRQVHIDSAMCNGCNVCGEMCPNDAIHWTSA